MALSKDKHYWSQLRIVITSGQWDASVAAKTPNGSPLSWSELLRKFNKHCTGFKDVAEVVSQTQALSLLLSAGCSKRGSNLDCHSISSKGSLDLGNECVLLQERFQEAEVGYNILKELPQSDSTDLVLAYYAYALSRPSECLAYIARINDLTNPYHRIPTAKSNTSELDEPAPHESSSLPSWTGSFGALDNMNYASGIRDGRAWALTEAIRSICLHGMSHEKLFPSELKESFRIYSLASPLLQTLESEIPRSVPTTVAGTSDAHFSSFTQYRELWRWVDRLLWRSIIIAARISSDDTFLNSLFKHYRTCSAHWLPHFRPEHRSTIAVLHLQFLVSRANCGIASSKLQVKPPHWLTTARSVIQEYRSILSASTRFPRAGERNVKVEDLVDLCVAVWEASGAVGEHAGWVVDILWWATRLTFNSYRVFRHMTRLFYVSGDVDLAKRTLKLYTQIVSKAWETAQAETSQMDEEDGSPNSIDVDTNKNWVETLVQGSRMLCRLSLAKSGCVIGSTGNGMEEAREAGRLLEKAKARLDNTESELAASVDLAEGIWNVLMAYKEQDPLTRTDRLSESLRLCKRAVDSYPTASGHYHLALALARPGPLKDVDKAIEYARLAVEEDSTDIRHWHLLGLLLVAMDDWNKAKGVLEYGAAIGEDKSDGEDEASNTHTNGVNGNDSALEPYAADDSSDSRMERSPLLDRDCIEIPESSTLLQPLPDHPIPSRRDMFEQSLQLRMTQLALTEYVEGPEGAVDKWLEVFRWVSEQKDLMTDDRRTSLDSNLTSMDARSSSNQTISGRQRESTPYVIEEEPKIDVPITITPASPLDQTHFTASQTTDELPGDSTHRLSPTRQRVENSTGKKVSKMLKSQVHRGQERISSISKIIGQKTSHDYLRRTSSAPDINSLFRQRPYQASSIHSRKRLNFAEATQDPPSSGSPSPPPPPPIPSSQAPTKWDGRAMRERRLLSELWSMSAATFRRLGKIEQARGAIQEAEVRDETNPAVWVQLGLYHMALNDELKALPALHQALFIAPENISAIIHLCKIYLLPSKSNMEPGSSELDPDRVDLAAGMLRDLTQGDGWDIPEAWYFLAKAYRMQGRSDKERECLSTALVLSETTRVRQVVDAVGLCL